MKKTILILSIITLFFAGCTKDDVFHEGDVFVNGVPDDAPEKSEINGHEYVDLGLPSGLLWATCNVGATTPEEYGDYFAWGETGIKSNYSESNCPTYGYSASVLQSQGYIDGDGNLTPQYDAATANWGEGWRMPKTNEMQELIDDCTWTWITQNGVAGYKVIGPNGNSIFLPAAGYRFLTSLYDIEAYGIYWSSTIKDNKYRANSLYFYSDNHYLYDNYRYNGRSVRPVISGDFKKTEQPEEPEGSFANETITVNGVSFTMIAVEGGTFKMGAQSSSSSGDNYDSDAESDESPVHSVTLSSYYIGETEVTQELWEAVTGNNPSYHSGYPQRPVEYVSWNDCQEFIKKLNQLTGKNFRLPTEAEWEYAARGGNKSKGYKYSGSYTIDDVAWYEDNSEARTHNVKVKNANELGIYDMSGNVLEWCQDCYGSNYYSSSPENNPTGPTWDSNRVLRGGGLLGSARRCRVSYRYNYYPDYRYNYFGLRLAL